MSLSATRLMDIGKSGGGTNIVVKSGPGQGDPPGSVCRREIAITAYDSETSACAKKKGVSRGQKSFMVLVSLVTERNGPSRCPSHQALNFLHKRI